MQQYHLKNRPNREIVDNSVITDILEKAKYAVISLCRNNEPYIVTLSYGFDEDRNALYFHCAPHGLKLDFIRENSLVCATIIEDNGYVTNECGHNYRTLVFWGNMTIVNDLAEKAYGMNIILDHLEKDSEVVNNKLEKLNCYYSKMTVLKLEIKQIHGKEGR